MNKKFFAALASATMAFTASGSIAVFADDFVEENTPVVDNGDVTPLPETVLWNKDNFGALVKLTGNNTVFTGLDGSVTLTENKEVKTADLAEVTAINLTGLKGEIKGLEYFTKLGSFDDSAATVTNTKLDFSANKVLTTLSVTKAADLSEIVLPEPTVTEKDGKKEEKYSLTTLTLKETALTSLDLSAQKGLMTVTVTENSNLKDVKVENGTKRDVRKYTTLDLSKNNLATIDLAYTQFDTLKLNENHIGALDLSNTTVDTTLELNDQKFYVSETLKNVNLAETFENFEKEAVKAQKDVYDQETGVLTLADAKETEYEYNTLVNGQKAPLKVKLEKANPMNRLYNPNSGEHFYTADIKEKAALVDLGWNDEGYGWVAPRKEDSTVPVYRLYNPNAGDHHYTMNKGERDTLVAYGWKDEGTGWYSDTAKTVAVFRQYNPYANGAGAHNYTTDKAENDHLVSLGWTPEGKAWYAIQ